jgi:hypothetical protein
MGALQAGYFWRCSTAVPENRAKQQPDGVTPLVGQQHTQDRLGLGRRIVFRAGWHGCNSRAGLLAGP